MLYYFIKQILKILLNTFSNCAYKLYYFESCKLLNSAILQVKFWWINIYIQCSKLSIPLLFYFWLIFALFFIRQILKILLIRFSNSDCKLYYFEPCKLFNCAIMQVEFWWLKINIQWSKLSILLSFLYGSSEENYLIFFIFYFLSDKYGKYYLTDCQNQTVNYSILSLVNCLTISFCK